MEIDVGRRGQAEVCGDRCRQAWTGGGLRRV